MRNGLFDTTLAAKVYERVRRGILSGELQPGQPMSRRRIATELNTSPLPVASAFQRLEFEGLLESRPRAGTRVREVSLKDVRDHFVVWEALETQVAMRVALMASALELKHLGTLAEAVDNSQLEGNQYSVLHSDFHRQIAEYLPMPGAVRRRRPVSRLCDALALAGLAPMPSRHAASAAGCRYLVEGSREGSAGSVATPCVGHCACDGGTCGRE